MQEAHRQGDRVPCDVGEPSPVPAGEDVFERRLNVRVEIEPAREPLRHFAHHRKRRTPSRGGVRDRVLEHRCTHIRAPTGPHIGLVEREHLRRVGRVDQEERRPVLDVVPEQLRRFVPVRRAARGVEERDVVRVRELLLRCPGELAEPDGEHGAPHGMLERLPRAEIGRE